VDEFKNNLFENYHGKNFNGFFISLGSKSAKELINLFRKIKTRLSSYNLFECEVLILYFILEPRVF
ncbi:P52 family lipoprotein, partial [Borreliella valaisiana]